MAIKLFFLLIAICVSECCRAQHRELLSETTGHRYVFYVPGAEPAPVDQLSNMRMNLSPCVERIAAADYTMQVGFYTDSDLRKVAQSGTLHATQSAKGVVTHIPRITLAARNKNLEIGMVLVLEYFSQDVVDKYDISRDMVEHIPLVLTERGQSVVFDGMGVTLYTAEAQTRHPSGRLTTRQEGKDLLGLIASLFDASGKLIFQQYGPMTLERHCSTAKPKPTQTDRH
ncbi:MAG: hypothetical protein LC657_02340, partial [Desulfobacteraceae bacterium]|nr:hypothetical protein [Desulfobacteraceae bacterium]